MALSLGDRLLPQPVLFLSADNHPPAGLVFVRVDRNRGDGISGKGCGAVPHFEPPSTLPLIGVFRTSFSLEAVATIETSLESGDSPSDPPLLEPGNCLM